MCKINPKNEGRRIDPCMKNLCKFIDTHPNVEVLACCCGHGKYNQSIVVKYMTGTDGKWKYPIMDLISKIDIPRKKRFYKRDKQGYYYIPEVINIM